MHIRAISVLAALLLPTALHAQPATPGCNTFHCAEDAIYQVAPAQLFAQGLYEGPTTFRELLRLGDFGLGALSPVDGEVIVLDGRAFHARYDGKVRAIEPDEMTPFAFVKRFHGDRQLSLRPAGNYDDLARALDEHLPSTNLLYAVRIDAEFAYLKLRSVPRQKPPYPRVDEVIRIQHVFEARDIAGTIVGFRFPAYLGSVNASGYHMHFVDAERKLGGHVLDIRTSQLNVSVDESRGLTLILPDDAAFRRMKFDDSPASDALQRAVRPDGDGRR